MKAFKINVDESTFIIYTSLNEGQISRVIGQMINDSIIYEEEDYISALVSSYPKSEIIYQFETLTF